MTDTKRSSSGAFVDRLQGGAPLYGSFVFSPDPAHSEIIAHAGFDFTILDMEHSSLGPADVLAHIRAAHTIAPLVRINSEAGPAQVAPLLDMGAAGIVIPHAGLNLEATAGLYASVRFPPNGSRPACRGVRANQYGATPFADYVRRSNSEVLTVGLIEDVEAVERIDEILDRCAFDIVMPGPNDLASSMGVHGRLDDDKVQRAVETVFAAASSRPRMRTAMYLSAPDEALTWAQLGVSIFVVSIDYRILALQYNRYRTEMLAQQR